MNLESDFKNFVLLGQNHIPNIETIDTYCLADGYTSASEILKNDPEYIKKEVLESELIDHDGEGILLGKKWENFCKDKTRKKILLCNAIEGHPGSFKDRYLIEKNPHLIIEGIVIASWALGVDHAFICLNGGYKKQERILKQAIAEAYEKNYLGKNIFKKDFNLEVDVFRATRNFINNDESALVSTLSGKRPIPQLVSVAPRESGFKMRPTMINSIESLAALPWIMKFGPAEYKKKGIASSSGTKLCSLSGDINRSGVFEVPMGTSMLDLIQRFGDGVREGRDIKAVLPGGVWSSPINALQIPETKICEKSLRNSGNTLGVGNIIVFDETRNMGQVLKWILEFYQDESCGHCTPCREGTRWMNKCWQSPPGNISWQEFMSIVKNIDDLSICSFPNKAILPINGIWNHFSNDIDEYIKRLRS